MGKPPEVVAETDDDDGDRYADQVATESFTHLASFRLTRHADISLCDYVRIGLVKLCFRCDPHIAMVPRLFRFTSF